MHELIAVVDDEPDIRELVSFNLTRNGFIVKEFADGASFRRFIDANKKPNLIVLDLMLPDTDGLEICKYIKGKSSLAHIPIVMLTAKSDETDTVLGLELGADDYIKKPFSPRELVARIKSVLRRAETAYKTSDTIEIDNLLIDPEKHAVFIDDQPIDVTATEFRILHLLASRRGRVFSREAILDAIWGNEKTVTDRTVDVHIKHLRSKLGSLSHLIQVVRGAGYKVEG
jgi:DNA-binding response OmpR family regulator